MFQMRWYFVLFLNEYLFSISWGYVASLTDLLNVFILLNCCSISLCLKVYKTYNLPSCLRILTLRIVQSLQSWWKPPRHVFHLLEMSLLTSNNVAPKCFPSYREQNTSNTTHMNSILTFSNVNLIGVLWVVYTRTDTPTSTIENIRQNKLFAERFDQYIGFPLMQ